MKNKSFLHHYLNSISKRWYLLWQTDHPECCHSDYCYETDHVKVLEQAGFDVSIWSNEEIEIVWSKYILSTPKCVWCNSARRTAYWTLVDLKQDVGEYPARCNYWPNQNKDDHSIEKSIVVV